MSEGNTIHIYSGKLYKWQSDAAKLLRRFRHDLILSILAPRQVGKTYFITMYALSQAINRKNHRVVIVNPTFANSKRTYNDLSKYVAQMPPQIIESANGSDLQIKFINGSTIQLKSIEQGNGLRGDHANDLIIDEAAFISTASTMSLLFPYVTSTKGNILLISTPTFKDDENLFYKFYKLGMEAGDKGYIRALNWATYDTSAILPPEKKELFRQTMPPNIFANEILGEFLSERNDLWNIEPVLKNGTIATRSMVGGLDWGASGTDSTVLTIFNNQREMYKIIRLDHNTPPTEQIKVLLENIKSFNISTVVYEQNSIGYVYADMLKKEAAKQNIKCRFIPFQTTNDSKRKAIENLQLQISNQTITLLNDPTLKLQFAHFAMKATPSGKITYENDSGNIHDDIVIASALALTATNTVTYNVK